MSAHRKPTRYKIVAHIGLSGERAALCGKVIKEPAGSYRVRAAFVCRGCVEREIARRVERIWTVDVGGTLFWGWSS